MPAMRDDKEDLLRLSRELLGAVDRGDWDTYSELCDESLTAFEPEAGGHLVKGLDFHRFYFESSGEIETDQPAGRRQSSMSAPSVRLMGDAAVVTYVRLVQTERGGRFGSSAVEETRVWQKRDGSWQHVHFHRALPTPLGG